MIIAVQGSKNFSDYDIFMRAMGVALSGVKEDEEVLVWTVGPHKINHFTATFCNLTEKAYMRSVGRKISYHAVPTSFVESKISQVNYFAYLCNPNEGPSRLTAIADFANVEVGIFRY